MKRRLGKYKRILPQALLLAFMLAALSAAVIKFGMASFGWFANNKEVEGNAMQARIYQDRRAEFTEYDAFKYDFPTAQGIKIPGTVESDGTLHLDMVMNDYDTIFTFRNEDAPLIIRFKLEGGSYEDGEKLELGLYRHNPSERPTDTSEHPNLNDIYLSDVVYFQCSIIDTSIIAENADDDTIYETAKDFFETGAGKDTIKSYFIAKDDYDADDTVVSTVETITNSFVRHDSAPLYLYYYVNYDKEKIGTALTNMGAQTLTSLVPLYSDVYQFKIEEIK